MMTPKIKVHFVDDYLISPTNPITINLIGAGGTGSNVLSGLMNINHSLIQLGHAGLSVRLWDDDIVEEHNVGRQRFADSEIGLNKSVVLINRINRWSGTDWIAETTRFEKNRFGKTPNYTDSNIYISCVDNVKSRFDIAEILKETIGCYAYLDRPLYWMDFGNSRHTGQFLISSIGEHKQPNSTRYESIGNLPFITEEFKDLIQQAEDTDDTPSCSIAEALQHQDLFINSSLAQLGCSQIWGMFRNGLIENRGFFMNLRNSITQPIPVG